MDIYKPLYLLTPTDVGLTKKLLFFFIQRKYNIYKTYLQFNHKIPSIIGTDLAIKQKYHINNLFTGIFLYLVQDF